MFRLNRMKLKGLCRHFSSTGILAALANNLGSQNFKFGKEVRTFHVMCMSIFCNRIIVVILLIYIFVIFFIFVSLERDIDKYRDPKLFPRVHKLEQNEGRYKEER